MRILVHPAPRMVTSGEGVSALSIKTPKFSSFAQFTQHLLQPVFFLQRFCVLQE